MILLLFIRIMMKMYAEAYLSVIGPSRDEFVVIILCSIRCYTNVPSKSNFTMSCWWSLQGKSDDIVPFETTTFVYPRWKLRGCYSLEGRCTKGLWLARGAGTNLREHVWLDWKCGGTGLGWISFIHPFWVFILWIASFIPMRTPSLSTWRRGTGVSIRFRPSWRWRT